MENKQENRRAAVFSVLRRAFYARASPGKSSASPQAYQGSRNPLKAVQGSREGVLKTQGFVSKSVSKIKGLPRAAGKRGELETNNRVMQGKKTSAMPLLTL